MLKFYINESDKYHVHSIETAHNFAHVQHVQNQENLYHKVTSIGRCQKGSRLVMTARRTGVKYPIQRMKDQLRNIFTEEDDSRFETRQINQVQTYSLRDIIHHMDEGKIAYLVRPETTKLNSTMSQVWQPSVRQKVPNPKLVAKDGVNNDNMDESLGIKYDNDAKDGVNNDEMDESLGIKSDNDMDGDCQNESQVDTDTELDDDREPADDIDYYDIANMIQEQSNGSLHTFIFHPLKDTVFLLQEEALKILFDKRICIETDASDKDGNLIPVLWAPMFDEKNDYNMLAIGKEMSLSFYKDYHNIQKSSIGGYIASNNIETCTGICLLHPERTASYDKIIEIARSKTLPNQRSFIFYGSGGSSKIKGSHPASIAALTCGTGGTLPSGQRFNHTNQCLFDLCRLGRPIHIVMKLKHK